MFATRTAASAIPTTRTTDAAPREIRQIASPMSTPERAGRPRGALGALSVRPPAPAAPPLIRSVFGSGFDSRSGSGFDSVIRSVVGSAGCPLVRSVV